MLLIFIVQTFKTDIKANNVLVGYDKDTHGQMIIKKVQILDLEDTVFVPLGKWLRRPSVVMPSGGALKAGADPIRTKLQMSFHLQLWYVCSFYEPFLSQ